MRSNYEFSCRTKFNMKLFVARFTDRLNVEPVLSFIRPVMILLRRIRAVFTLERGWSGELANFNGVTDGRLGSILFGRPSKANFMVLANVSFPLFTVRVF
jgi:hypothetical protein